VLPERQRRRARGRSRFQSRADGSKNLTDALTGTLKASRMQLAAFVKLARDGQASFQTSPLDMKQL